MTKINWDESGKRIYETGIDRGVLYLQGEGGTYPKGHPWNGLIGVTESPTGAEPNPLYADNIKYLNLMSVEEFGANIEAYTYPDEFGVCDGSFEPVPGLAIGQQPRKGFGLSYRTRIGNDVDGDEHGYKIHLVYGAIATPSDKSYQTINDTPDAITFSWDITTTPVSVTDHKPTAAITIDSTKFEAAKIKELEDILYGDGDTEARLPLPDEIIDLFAILP